MPQNNSPNLLPEEMTKILSEEDTGYLALCKGEKPYLVPLSYAWTNDSIVFHCALSGKKLEIIRENPHVCFVVARNPDRALQHHPEGECQFRFESVLCHGTARIIDNPSERLKYLKAFKAVFDARLGLVPEKNPVTLKAAENCGCVVIEVESMTGRRKGFTLEEK